MVVFFNKRKIAAGVFVFGEVDEVNLLHGQNLFMFRGMSRFS
jgi:hypothetical protein